MTLGAVYVYVSVWEFTKLTNSILLVKLLFKNCMVKRSVNLVCISVLLLFLETVNIHIFSPFKSLEPSRSHYGLNNHLYHHLLTTPAFKL